MKMEEVIMEAGRALLIFIVWGSVFLLFDFEITVVFILMYSLIIKRDFRNEDS